MGTIFDEIESGVTSSKNVFDEVEESQLERTPLNIATDTLVSTAKGVVGVGEAAAGAANLVTGGLAGKALDSVGYDPKQTQSFFSDLYSPAQKAANRKVDEAKGFVDTGKAMLQNPSTIFQGIVETAPAMLGGGAAARKGLDIAGKVAPKLMKSAGAVKWGGTVAGAGGEGLVAAGQQAEQIRQETPDKELSFGQGALAVASGIGTGAFGFAGGSLAKKLGFTDFDTFLATGSTGVAKKEGWKGVIRKIVGGGISEGAFEEAPQTIQETILYNAAMDKPLMEGVPESTAQALILGGVIGAGANMLPSRRQADVVQPPDDTAIPGAEQQPTPAPPTESPDPIVQDIERAFAPTVAQTAEAAIKERSVGPSVEDDLMYAFADQAQAGQDREDVKFNLKRLQENSVGRPSTAEDAAIAFEQQAPTQAMVDVEKRAARQDDIEAAFADKNALIPRKFTDAISKMENDLKQGQANGVIVDGVGNDATVTGGFPSTNPDWFKQSEIKKFDAENGTNYAENVSKASISMALKKVRAGQPLTGKAESRAWEYMRKAAEIEANKDPELIANREFAKFEKQGFEFEAPKTVAVGDISKGEEIVVLGKNGIPDKLTHKGRDESGNIILQDGVRMEVDEFDTIDVISKPRRPPSRSEKEQQNAIPAEGTIADNPEDIAAPRQVPDATTEQTTAVDAAVIGRTDAGVSDAGGVGDGALVLPQQDNPVQSVAQEPIIPTEQDNANDERIYGGTQVAEDSAGRSEAPDFGRGMDENAGGNYEEAKSTRNIPITDIKSTHGRAIGNVIAKARSEGNQDMTIAEARRIAEGEPTNKESLTVQPINEVQNGEVRQGQAEVNSVSQNQENETQSGLSLTGETQANQPVPTSGAEARTAAPATQQGAKNLNAERINYAPARNANKYGESAKRSKPKNTVVFSAPIKGKNGGEIASYQWSWTGGTKFDEREGGDVETRVSDWDNAIDNPETGRKIVHQFSIVTPQGESKVVSLESAQKILGIEGNLLNMVRHERNRSLMREALLSKSELSKYTKKWGVSAEIRRMLDGVAEALKGVSLFDLNRVVTGSPLVSDALITRRIKKHGDAIQDFISYSDLITGRQSDVPSVQTATGVVSDGGSSRAEQNAESAQSPAKRSVSEGSQQSASLSELPPSQRTAVAKNSNGEYSADINPLQLKEHYGQNDIALELEEALDGRFTIIPWRMPDSLVKQDKKGRVNMGGVPRSDYELSERLAKIFGKEVVWISALGEGRLNGVVVRSGNLDKYIFIDVRSSIASHVVYGHELSHHLETSHPQQYNDLFEIVSPLIKDVAEYRDRLKLADTDTEVKKEIIGDLLGDSFADPRFWAEVAAQSPSKFKKIAAKIRLWISSILNRFAVRGYDADYYTTDLKATRVALAKLMVQVTSEKQRGELLKTTGNYFSERAGSDALGMVNDGINSFAQDAKMSVEKAKRVIQNLPAFKKWFDGSKVVDENGEPLVVYHGTPNVGFTEFYTGNVGAFFSSRFDVASSYAGRYNEVEIEDDKPISDDGQGVYEAYLSIKNPKTVDWGGKDWGSGPNGLKLDEVANRAKKDGYDGLIVENVEDTGWLAPGLVEDGDGNGTVYVAFEPTQIKSIFNTQWDGTNPDIMKSVSSPMPTSANFRKWFGSSVVRVPVFHGSPTFGKKSNFTFDPDRPGPNTQSPGAGLGTFFTEDRTESLGYAGTDGESFPMWLRIENPLEMNSFEIPNFNDRAEAAAFRRRKMLQGYDGIHLKDLDHWIIFEPGQAKSGDRNNGEYSRKNYDVRYSLGQTAEDKAGMFRDLLADEPYVKKLPTDATLLSKIFSTPEYTFKKAAAAWRALNLQYNRMDEKIRLENDVFGAQVGQDGKKTGFIQTMEEAKKKNKADYKKANDYLLDTDRTGKGFTLERKDNWEVKSPAGDVVGYAETQVAAYKLAEKDHAKNYKGTDTLKSDYKVTEGETWTLKNRDGKEIDSFDNDREAVKAMMDAEGEFLRSKGLSEKVVELVREYREMTNRAFDMMIADLRKIIAEAKEAGLDEPTVSVVDETKRWAVLDGGKVIATFAEKQDAQKFGGGKHTIKEQADDDIRKRMKLSEVIAQMSDLRGTYFSRSRPRGSVVLRAEKDGEKVMKKFDFHMVEDEYYDIETGQKYDRTPLNWMKKTFNFAMSKIPGTLANEMNRLKRDGYTILSVSKEESVPESVFEAAKLVSSMSALLEEAKDKAEKKGVDKSIVEQSHKILTSALADIIKQRGYMSSRLKRSRDYWKGFEEDMLLSGTQYGRGLAAGIAKKQFAKDLIATITGVDIKYKDWKDSLKDGEEDSYEAYLKFVANRRIDPTKQPTLYGEVMSWSGEMLRNEEQADRIMGTLQGIAVIKFLGLRLSSAAVNATNMLQAVPATISSLSGGTIRGALNEVRKAVTTYAAWKRGGNISDSDRAVLLEIVNNGWDEPQFNKDSVSVLQSKLGRGWSSFSEFAMKAFAITEKVNRTVTILSAYNQFKANTSLSHDELLKKAKHASDRAHGVYGKATRPVWTYGGWNPAKLAFTFAKFGQNYAMNMVEMGLRGDHKAVAYMLLSPAVLAGAGASVVTPLVAALAGALGIGGDDPEEEFYQWVEDNFGSDRLARHGLAGLLGINLKGSIQMNNPMPTTIAEIFGAPGAIYTDTKKGIESLGKGEFYKGAEALLPTALGTMSKAARESTEGITTGNYSPVYYGNEPIKADGLEATIRFFGFNPARISGIREKQWREKQVANNFADRREEINSMIKKVYIYGKGDRMELMKEIRRYNEMVKGSGRKDITLIKPSEQIRRVVNQARRPSKVERMRER